MFDTYTSGEEAKNNSERIRRARRTTAQHGEYIPGFAPYGYRHKRALVRIAARSRSGKWLALRSTRKRRRWPGKSSSPLPAADRPGASPSELNHRGVLPPGERCGGTPRSPASSRTRPTRANRPRSDTSSRATGERASDESRLRPVEEHIKLPTEVAPALVSPDVWQRANDQLAANKTGARRTAAEPGALPAPLRVHPVRLLRPCDRRRSGSRVSRTTSASRRVARPRGDQGDRELDGAVWGLVEQVLRHPDWIRGQLEDQADDSLGRPHRRASQGTSTTCVAREARLTKSLQLLDDPSSIIPELNALAASRKLAATGGG